MCGMCGKEPSEYIAVRGYEGHDGEIYKENLYDPRSYLCRACYVVNYQKMYKRDPFAAAAPKARAKAKAKA